MSLVMVQRFTISCFGKCKINYDVCRRIASSWHLTQRKSLTEHVESRYTCTIHTRLYHGTRLLCTNKLKQDEDITEDMSTLQIKKRPLRRNRIVISDEKTLKNDVSHFDERKSGCLR